MVIFKLRENGANDTTHRHYTCRRLRGPDPAETRVALDLVERDVVLVGDVGLEYRLHKRAIGSDPAFLRPAWVPVEPAAALGQVQAGLGAGAETRSWVPHGVEVVVVCYESPGDPGRSEGCTQPSRQERN